MTQINRITTWANIDSLQAAALNNEFNNIINAWNNTDAGVMAWTNLSVSGTTTFTGATTFATAITITPTSNQIVLGATRTVTISAGTPASSSRTWTIPDITGNGTFASLEGTQTFSGAKTFSAQTIVSGSINNQFIARTSAADSISAQLDNTNANGHGSLMTFNTSGAVKAYIGIDSAYNGSATDQGLSFATATAVGFRWYLNASVTASMILDSSGNLSVANLNRAAGTAVHGSNTNTNPAAGYIGEYIESNVTSPTSAGTSAQFVDATSISLTAGDWDISAALYVDANGANVTDYRLAVSVTSGNSSTGLLQPVNYMLEDSSATIATGLNSITMPNYRVLLTTTTIHYCKVFITYSVATPQYRVAFNARRRS